MKNFVWFPPTLVKGICGLFGVLNLTLMAGGLSSIYNYLSMSLISICSRSFSTLSAKFLQHQASIALDPLPSIFLEKASICYLIICLNFAITCFSIYCSMRATTISFKFAYRYSFISSLTLTLSSFLSFFISPSTAFLISLSSFSSLYSITYSLLGSFGSNKAFSTLIILSSKSLALVFNWFSIYLNSYLSTLLSSSYRSLRLASSLCYSNPFLKMSISEFKPSIIDFKSSPDVS